MEKIIEKEYSFQHAGYGKLDFLNHTVCISFKIICQITASQLFLRCKKITPEFLNF